MTNQVFITGIGLMTPVGQDVSGNRKAIQAGVVGMSPIELFDTSRYRCKIAGQILGLKPHSRQSRASCILESVIQEALGQAGWTREMTEKAPLSVGTTNGGMFEGERFFQELNLEKPDERRCEKNSWLYPVSRQMQDLERHMGIYGIKRIFSNACASGANSIGHAYQMIKHGIWTHALAGGYDAMSELSFAGFDCLRSLTTTQCQPFSRGRSGLLLGEGAGMVCLESAATACARKATRIAEVLGYGATTDTYHHTQHNPDGKVAARSMTLAMDAGRISAHDIGYVNAHGTATVINDLMEATAIREALGTHTKEVMVSSIKGAIGHLLGGAGSVEAIITALSVSEKWVPPTLNVMEIDPVCDFHLVCETEEAPQLSYALTNSFGFGGACASLLVGEVA